MTLTYPFVAPPETGTLVEVAPGIHWFRMPLPFALDHINLWVLDDGDGWTLVDTGVANDDTRAVWEALLAGPLAGRPVTRLVCTHFHPDHMGLAGWLAERFGILMTASQGEWLYGRMLWLDESDEYRVLQREFYRRAGWDAEQLEALWGRGNTYRPRVGPIPPTYHRIQDCDVLTIGGRRWTVMIGQGHAPEHVSLWCEEANVLIAGDQVLPRISPIIGVWPQEPDGDPLGLFLASLPRFAALPADTLVLPSHGLPFQGLRERVADLIHHHDERLARTLAACSEPVTALEVLRVLFRRPLDAWQIGFATGETLAHLNHLVTRGALARWSNDVCVSIYQRS
jgi:glyoxylase-like metal-dependent hydrolase (beta-lactamase superfamily II)